MKLNADKYHLLPLGQRGVMILLLLGLEMLMLLIALKRSYLEFKMEFKSRLSFDNHVSKLCQKLSNKLYTLARIFPYMDQSKLLMRAFITSQFQYCPLSWMFHSRQLNQKNQQTTGKNIKNYLHGY